MQIALHNLQELKACPRRTGPARCPECGDKRLHPTDQKLLMQASLSPVTTLERAPLRTNETGAEVIFILFRQPGMSDEKFRADAEQVKKDLQALTDFLKK